MSPQEKERLCQALGRLSKYREDQEAWRTVFVSTWATAVATANRVLHGMLELAEDAAQDAFFKIVRYTSFAEVTDPDAFLGYLRAVSRNAALDTLKRLVLHRNHSEADLLLASGEWSDVLPTPEETYVACELQDEFINHLDSNNQLLIGMLIDGYTVGEICNNLGITYSAAGVRIHRLRERLRKHMVTKQM